MTRTTTTKAATKHGVSVKSNVKAGFNFVIKMSASSPNHNQTVRGLRVKSSVKAGKIRMQDILFTNHNQTVRGLRVKSGVKAGLNFTKITYVS